MLELKRYCLKVPLEQQDYAMRHGAQLDESSSTFYVLGDIPEPLEVFAVERVERDLLSVQRPPKCPTCRAPMIKKNSMKTGDFWGCSNYPGCKSTRTYAAQRLDVTGLLFNDPATLLQSSVASERATPAHYLRIAQKALQVHGVNAFQDWLFGPNAELGNLSPADLLGTTRGVAYVEQLLLDQEKRNEV